MRRRDGDAAPGLEVPRLAKILVELPGIAALPSVSGPGGTPAVEAALCEALDRLLAGGTLPLGGLLSPQARAASLRTRHGRKTRIKPTSTFVPVSGHASAASATVGVR